MIKLNFHKLKDLEDSYVLSNIFLCCLFLNLYKNGVAKALNISDSFIALTTASHHAENIHQKMISDWLKKINLKESHLSCGPSWPWNMSDQFKAHAKYKIKRKREHLRQIFKNPEIFVQNQIIE